MGSAEEQTDTVNTEKTEVQNQETKSSGAYYESRPEFSRRGPSWLKDHLNQGMTYILVVIFCLIIYFAFLRIEAISHAISGLISIMKPVLYGFAVAYLLNPIIVKMDEVVKPKLEKKMSKKKAANLTRALAIALAITLLLTVVLLLFNMLIPALYTSVRSMVNTLPSQLSDLADQIKSFSKGDSTTAVFFENALEEGTTFIQKWLRTDLMSRVNTLMSNLTVGVINVVRELFNCVIGVIISVYLLFGKEKMMAQCKKMTYAFMRQDKANMLLHLVRKSDQMFGGFIIGKLLDSAIIGVLCFIVLTILKMPYTLLVSVIVGVTNFIPFFGPYIGAIPSALLIFLDNPKKGITFVVFILILQQIDGNIIGPKILGNSTGLSTFWVVFSILLGGGLFGFVGMIMGVPTFAVIYYVIMMITNQKLQSKQLPELTRYYGENSYIDNNGKFVEDDLEEK